MESKKILILLLGAAVLIAQINAQSSSTTVATGSIDSALYEHVDLKMKASKKYSEAVKGIINTCGKDAMDCGRSGQDIVYKSPSKCWKAGFTNLNLPDASCDSTKALTGCGIHERSYGQLICTQCLEGYYLNPDQTCFACSEANTTKMVKDWDCVARTTALTNCKTVASNNNCQTCDDGYILNGTACDANVKTGCKTWSDKDTCATCESGKWLNGASCEASTATNCDVAGTAVDKCAYCKENFVHINGGTNTNTCVAVKANSWIPNCRYMQKTGDDGTAVCTTCATGYTRQSINGINKCLKQYEGCTAGNMNSNGCTECDVEKGYHAVDIIGNKMICMKEPEKYSSNVFAFLGALCMMLFLKF